MDFVLGYIAGIVTAGLVFTILAFFRSAIEHRVKIIEKQLESAGPKPKGVILMPEDEADIARREHIKKNRARGVDTLISELQ